MMRSQPKWATEKLGEIALFKTGKLDSNAAVTDGKYPFFTCSQETLRTNTFSFDTECVLLAGNNAAGIFPLKYFRGKFDAYQRTYVITPRNSERLDVRFLYYALRPKLAEFRSISTGAATKFLTLGILNETLLQIPPLGTQCRIAAILGAYDDLIEINRRRIAVLEEMARGLFTEWFIRLRFPGHENVAIEDTPDGPLPVGWSWGTLGDVCQVVRSGSTPSRKLSEYWDDGVLDWFTTGELNDGFLFSSKERVSSKALEDGKARLFPAGTVFIALYGATIGKLGVSRNECSSNQAALGIVPDGERMGRWQLFHVLQNLRDWFISIGQGAAQQNISKEKVTGAPVILPPRKIAENFHRIVSPIWELRAIVEEQILGLSAARDFLLPRLISGQLSVAQAERELEAVA